MAVLSAGVVLYVLRAQSGTADAATWGVLTGVGVVGAAVLIGAARSGRGEARRSAQRQASVAQSVARDRNEFQAMLGALQRGERVTQPYLPPQPPAGTDALGRLAQEIVLAQYEARAAVFAQAAQFAQVAQDTEPADAEDRVEVFVNLARRLQSLAHRQLSRLEALENEVEDPELLTGLFQVDHMATRIRRHAENVAVLGGSVSRRQWSKPVTLMEVLRSSISEIEHYSRVKLVPPIEGSLRGHAVADVIHLLAELLENATQFSDPSTHVMLRAQRVTAGLAIEVEDRGLGIPAEEQERLNALLTEPDRVDLSKLLVDGRIGLYVVSELSRRHGIDVRLQRNIFGGIQAILVLPHGLIGDESTEMPRQATVEASRPLPPAVPETPALHAGDATGYARPQLNTAEPMPAHRPTPQGQSVAASAPRPQREVQRPAERVRAPASHDPGPHDEDSHAGRPELPQRQPQEHLVAPLREAPAARMTGGMQSGEADPGLMATFQRGAALADEVSDSSADDSR